MEFEYGGHSAVAPLQRALLRRPQWIPGSQQCWAGTWGYEGEPDLAAAQREHDAFAQILREHGTTVHYLEGKAPDLYDLVFTYDTALITNRGAIILRSGKQARVGEADIVDIALSDLGIPIIHRMRDPVTCDGGDCLWVRDDLLVIGRSYRTNAGESGEFTGILNDMGVEVRSFPVPHWTGPGDVMHLLSLISLIDSDLAVAYRRVMSVEMVKFLENQGIEFVDVSDEEFDGGLGANVLAVAPRQCIMLEGYPGVRRGLESAGARVQEFQGDELCHGMNGGPTCMTLSLLRSPDC